jgi:hypothetical protein
MWARVDGWLVLYCGNGAEGFRLTEDYAQSVASDGKILELAKVAGEASGWMRWRVSEGLLEELPLWLNDSPAFRARAMAIFNDATLKNQTEMTDALFEIAKTRSLLSRREVEADWYGIAWRENGLRMETVGGMRKPGLNYDKTWTFTGGADSAGTFIKAQWVAEQSRIRWEWQQAEAGVSFLMAALSEWWPEDLPISQEFFDESIAVWGNEMMSLGLEMKSEGLGGECVLAVDLLGEMPQVPDASGRVVEEGVIPRILFAQTVKDRSKVRETGTVMWNRTAELYGEVDGELAVGAPFPGLMTSEDEGLKSSFVLLPFSNDDFLLNAALNDEVLIQGTSRNHAMLFEVGRRRGGEEMSGFLFEMDLKHGASFLNHWNALADSSLLPFEQAEMLLNEAGLENEESLQQKMTKLGKIYYHHRMEEGELRTSFALEIAD